MTKTEYFDLLVKSATDGTFPAISEHGGCCYRSPDGKKCAIGLLIENYSPDMEDKWISELLPFINIPDGLTVSDLQNIQFAHDNLAKNWNPDQFIENIKKVFEEMS